jgi:type IV pilus assembly protein PilA
MKAPQQGLTLVEWLIVLAIIVILAALTVPAILNTVVARAQVKNGLSLAQGWEIAIQEYYATIGSMPSDQTKLAGAGASTSQYVQSIKVDNGQIIITYGNAVNASISGKVLSLTPERNANNDIVWLCGSAPAPAGANLSTIPNTPHAVVDDSAVAAQYLPDSCRS